MENTVFFKCSLQVQYAENRLRHLLAFLLYNLTNSITVALAWCAIVTKMPRRTGWKAGIKVVSPTHSLPQTPLIRLVLNMSFRWKWWEWEVMAPAHWLWQCQKLTRTQTRSHTFLLMMQSSSQKDCEICQWTARAQNHHLHSYKIKALSSRKKQPLKYFWMLFF